MSYTQWTAGTRITASKLAGITPKFADWTPTWTTAGASTPSYGNATLNCRYCQSGDLVIAYFEVTFGNTTTFGSGGDNWRFSMPVPSGLSGTPWLGAFDCFFGSAGTRTAAKARQSTTSTFALEILAAQPDGTAPTATGEVDNAAPETWASGNILRGQLMYEAA